MDWYISPLLFARAHYALAEPQTSPYALLLFRRETERMEFSEAKERLKHSWAADRDDFARVKEALKKKNADHHVQNGRLSQALKVHLWPTPCTYDHSSVTIISVRAMILCCGCLWQLPVIGNIRIWCINYVLGEMRYRCCHQYRAALRTIHKCFLCMSTAIL